jgi:repressor LexA
MADRSRSEPLVLPLVGTVQAGLPQLAEEQIETYLAVDSSLVKGKDSFLLRVRGESMIDAHIMPGDLVVVRPQPSAESGEIVVALIDDEATLKRFYREGEEIRLKPENARMKSLIYRERDAQVQIIGKVTGLCRPLG